VALPWSIKAIVPTAIQVDPVNTAARWQQTVDGRVGAIVSNAIRNKAVSVKSNQSIARTNPNETTRIAYEIESRTGPQPVRRSVNFDRQSFAQKAPRAEQEKNCERQDKAYGRNGGPRHRRRFITKARWRLLKSEKRWKDRTQSKRGTRAANT
jgi:hypothetical protein